MIRRALPCSAVLLCVVGAASCHAPAPPPPAEVAVRGECRAQVERQYLAQNRADLTRREQRDQPFADGYNVGISSRGLGAEYQRDRMVADCLRANAASGAPAAGTGPALTPGARGQTGSSGEP